MSTTRYVVTGAGGFIGRHLANALAAGGDEVIGVDLRFPKANGADPLHFTAVVGDFRDCGLMQDAMRGASVLYHLASAHLQISLPESEYWDVNAHSVRPLLERARNAGVKRCIHTSSVGVYGEVGTEPADERTTPDPQSIYGRTKLAGERAALGFARSTGFSVVVIRPAWVFGPGCPRTQKICDALRTRRFLMIGSGNNLRHPVYIDDMTEAFRLAAREPDANGQTLNVAGERAVTTRELIDSFRRVFGIAQRPLRVPYIFGSVAATLTEHMCGILRCEPPISRRTLEFFNTNNVFDTSRAATVLGFRPRYSLEEGLAMTRDRVEGIRT